MSDSDSDVHRPVSDDDTGAVSLADLVQPIRDKAEFGSLKKQIARIDASEKALSSTCFFLFGSQSFLFNLTAPLPRTQKERIERKLAYEQASKDVSRWLPQVRQNRLVRRFMTFPDRDLSHWDLIRRRR